MFALRRRPQQTTDKGATVPEAKKPLADPARDASLRKILGRDDGVIIPLSLQMVLLPVLSRGKVTLYAASGNEDEIWVHLDSIMQALTSLCAASPELTWTDVADLTRIREEFETSSYQTVSGERRAAALLRECRESGATDITFKQFPDQGAITVRIDGDHVLFREGLSKQTIRDLCHTLHTMSDQASKKFDYSESSLVATSLITNLKQYGLDDIFAAVRCLFAPHFTGPECHMRLQPAGQTARPLAEIGLSGTALSAIEHALAAQKGAMLISGPLGSGKTNLLASIVLYYHQLYPGRKITTVEDPVELFIAKMISQWAVSGDGEERLEKFLHFVTQVVRSDAQMFMVQELRDKACANEFMNGAKTGMLALATVHASTPSGIISRLKDWEIRKGSLIDAGVIQLLGGVRLVQKLCDCKIEIGRALRDRDSGAGDLEESVARMQRFANRQHSLFGMPARPLTQGFTRNVRGCDICRSRSKIKKQKYGVIGRLQIAEMIPPDAKFLELLYGDLFDEAEQHLRAHLRVPTLADDAIDHIIEGRICPIDAEEAIGEVDDPKSFIGGRLAAGGSL